jgi:hypothetical protein
MIEDSYLLKARIDRPEPIFEAKDCAFRAFSFAQLAELFVFLTVDVNESQNMGTVLMGENLPSRGILLKHVPSQADR